MQKMIQTGSDDEPGEFTKDPGFADCGLCLEMIEGDVMCCPKCKKNLICRACIKGWKKPSCPFCREKLTKKDYIMRPETAISVKAHLSSFCKEHPTEKRRTYCMTCEVSVCDFCLAEEHVGHKRKKLNSESQIVTDQLVLTL